VIPVLLPALGEWPSYNVQLIVQHDMKTVGLNYSMLQSEVQAIHFYDKDLIVVLYYLKLLLVVIICWQCVYFIRASCYRHQNLIKVNSII